METVIPISDDPRYQALVHSLKTGEPVCVGDGVVLNVREYDPGWGHNSNDDENN